MSGFVGIVHLDGAPIDRDLLARLTASLAFRGPDAQRSWINGPVGFGHTLLKTTDESDHEQQPFSLDGNVWVVADARIDARVNLISEMRVHGRVVESDVPDVVLIAHAYAIWLEKCVDHLLGDFAFGVWDAHRQSLFCARDPMGIKSLFYAFIGQRIVFSNTLDCIRRHPSISDRLNDQAVADFLLFNLNQDKLTTSFADIARVPPAHTAVWSENGLRMRRYWSLSVEEPVCCRRADDYVDRFAELLTAAVEDRLRTPRVGIFMSGGLDSTTLACAARDCLRGRQADSGVRAFTVGEEGNDPESHYADLAARHLGIPIEFRSDAESLNPRWYETRLHTPEPVCYPTSLAASWASFQAMASHSPVAFFGEGPDNALRCEWRPYFRYLIRKGRFGRILYDLYFQTILHRRIPIPTIPWIAKLQGRDKEHEPPFPDWLQPAFEKRLQLRSRWEQLQTTPTSLHPIRPEAYIAFGSPLWQPLFESYEPPYTQSALEVRHPFLDLRLLQFMLAVPALPWCRSKYLIRRAMRGRLPNPVLRRPKSPLVHDPWVERMNQLGLPPVTMTPALAEYIDGTRVQRTPAAGSPQFWVDFRVRSLAYWFENINLLEEIPQTVPFPLSQA